MPKIKIEIKKPQYLAAKPAARPVPRRVVRVAESGELHGFFRFLLFLAYLCLGFAVILTVRLLLKR